MADLKSPSRFSIRGIYNSLTSEPKAAAPAPSPAPAPKQEPSQPSAISSYAGMIAQQRREKEAGLKDGGQMKDGASGTVPGKGKGDKIKAKYEPGEFVVSNAMLSANPGLEQYLSQLRTKALAAQGKSPEDTVAGSFKGGVIHALNGLDPNEEAKRMQRKSFGDAAAAATDPNITQLKVGKPGDFPLNPGGNTIVPAAASTNTPATGGFGIDPARGIVPGSADGGPIPGTRAVMQGYGQDASENINKGQYGALVGNTLRATAAMVPAAISDIASPVVNALAPVGQGIANAVKTFATGDSSTANFGRSPGAPVAPVQPVATPVAAPVAAQPGKALTDVQRGGASAPSPAAQAAPMQAPSQTVTPTSVDGVTRIDRPGQSPMFTNLSASDPSNQSLAARGVPSAQNVAAANNLSQHYATAPVVPTQAQDTQGYEPATIRHSGNDWRAQNDLRNLQVSASSITNRPGYGYGGRNGVAPDVQAYLKAVETDQALKRGDNPDVISRNKDGSANERAGILERGAISRTAMQEAGANNRAVMTNQVASQRAGAEISKLAAETQAMNQLQALREQLINEKDPAKQATLSEKMQVIMGKYQRPEPAARDVYGAIAGGVDALGNKTDPIIYNKQTGERAGAQAQQLPPGMTKQVGTANGKPVYEDANGKRFAGN